MAAQLAQGLRRAGRGRWPRDSRGGKPPHAPSGDRLASSSSLALGWRSISGRWEAAPVRPLGLACLWAFLLACPAAALSPAIPAHGKFGVIDRTGRTVIPATYDAMTLYSDDTEISAIRLAGGVIPTSDRTVYFVSRSGSVKISGFSLPDVHEGEPPLFRYGPEPAHVSEPTSYGVSEKIGYVDQRGRFFIPPQFQSARRFGKGGLAAAEIGTKWGYIDRKGNFAIAPQFDGAGDFAPNGLALVRQNGSFWYISKNGQNTLRPQAMTPGKFSDNGLALVTVDGKFGFMDATGKCTIAPRFDLAWEFGVDAPNQNLAKVSEGDRISYINSYGKYVVRLAPGITPWDEFWKRPGAFQDRATAKWGYLGKSGEVSIPAQFETEGKFSDEGLAPVMSGKLWGYIDTTGRFAIPPMFDGAASFSFGLAPAAKGNKWGYIDRTGHFVIAPQYDSAGSFTSRGLARIEIGRPS
jgi:hypothetical protein